MPLIYYMARTALKAKIQITTSEFSSVRFVLCRRSAFDNIFLTITNENSERPCAIKVSPI